MTGKSVSDLQWYAYLHNHGSISVKRYFGSSDIYHAKRSPFIKKVTGPFSAPKRSIAEDIAVARLR